MCFGRRAGEEDGLATLVLSADHPPLVEALDEEPAPRSRARRSAHHHRERSSSSSSEEEEEDVTVDAARFVRPGAVAASTVMD